MCSGVAFLPGLGRLLRRYAIGWIGLWSERLHMAAIATVVVSASVFRVFSTLGTNRKGSTFEREWERERSWLN